MNLVSGGQQWMRPLPMRPAWGAVQAGSTIVVAGQTPPLRAFNIKDGVAPARDGSLTQARRPIAARTRRSRRRSCRRTIRCETSGIR